MTDSWLELLAEERSPTELERLRQDKLDSSPSSEHARVERDGALAMRIRGALEERKQHADQLAVLNNLARRLASMRDPVEVLQEVAEQARRLLAVDVAYIMLLRPQGDLVIEVVDGSMGSVLRGIVLRPGSGLGGEVVRTGRPMWSEDYLADTAFPHMTTTDAAATDEQLGGILGVPLIVGNETIGVLLTAERRPRRFAGREVELLAALAAHAAVAIRNADLFEKARAAAADLLEANRAMLATTEMRQRASDLRERLTEEVIRGGGFAQVARELEHPIGAPVAVFGAHDEVLAGHPGAWTPPWEGDRPAVVQRMETPHGYAVAVPVVLRSGYAGAVVASSDQPFDDEALRLLAIGSSAVALIIASERSVAESELRTRSEFVNALLSPEASDATIRRRAAGADIRLEDVTAVVVLDPGPDDVAPANRLAARLASETRGLAAEHADHVVLLVSGMDAGAVKQRIARLHPDHPPCAVGIAPCDGGMRAVRLAHETARQTTTVLIALGRERDCVLASELGVYRSLFSQAGRAEIVSFVELTIGPLLSHDRARGRDLAVTLSTYLELSRHHARTCAALHIHANTLYQRLDRVTQLLGPGWNEPRRCLEVQLALRMHDLLLSLAPG